MRHADARGVLRHCAGKLCVSSSSEPGGVMGREGDQGLQASYAPGWSIDLQVEVEVDLTCESMLSLGGLSTRCLVLCLRTNVFTVWPSAAVVA